MGTRPHVLAVLPGFIPSTVLTVVKPLTALHRAGQIVADIALESWVSRRKIERADVVIFSRNTELPFGQALDFALACGKPVIYDLDDNFFELPAYYQHELSHRTPERLAQLERYLTTATLVRVYSEPMGERVRQLNPQVSRVDGVVDWQLLPPSPPRRDPLVIRIVYPTSRWSRDDLSALFLEDLQQILAVYQGRVEVYFWGYHPPELQGHPAVHCLDFVPDYDRFFRQFASAGFDIGLAPLRDDVFYRSKSNNKFREYAACRIAGVYSDVDVYSACVEDGERGLLVSTESGAWFKALARLIEDAGLRERIQEQAFGYARAHYSLEKFHAVWLEHIFRAIADARGPSSRGLGSLPAQQNGTHTSPPLTYRASAHGQISLRFLPHLARRGIRLASRLKTQGPVATVNRVLQPFRDLRTLLRVRWNLSPASSCWSWYKRFKRNPGSP